MSTPKHPTLKQAAQEVVEELLAVDYKNAPRWAPLLRTKGEVLQEALQRSTGVTLPYSTFDKLAGLLTLLQQQDPVDLMKLGHEVQRLNADLVALGSWISNKIKLTQAARLLQEELRAMRGAVVTCYLCSPPRDVKIEELVEHDAKLHNAYMREK